MSDLPITDDHSVEPFGLPQAASANIEMTRETVEVLASRFIEEHRRGLAPRIDDYALRHPQHASEIKRLFPLVAAMEDWKHEKSRQIKTASPGSTLNVDRLGDCRIVREIGRGGMGVVFEAVQDPPGRRVAVKILPAQQSPDSPWREQFAYEARLAARLRHQNIVPVYQYGEEEGFSYYVMPFIHGVGLDWVIQRLAEGEGIVTAEAIRGALEAGSLCTANPEVSSFRQRPPQRQLGRHAWKKIAKIGVQAAAALQHAHSKGLLHRDIKPGNLLLDADGVVWITDFGLARQISHADESSEIVGTLRYMSPEHLVGSTDERSDVYSLGVTLHELCTLRPAFKVRTRTELRQAIRQGSLTDARAVVPQIPEALEAVLVRATATDPARRYPSADEFRSDLLRFINDQPISAASRRWLNRHRKRAR